MRLFLLTLMFLVCSAAALCLMPFDKEAQAAENPVRPAWGSSAAPTGGARVTTTVVRVPAEAKELTPCQLRKGLSRKERREVGATLRNVRRILGELQAADPVGFEQSSSEELALDVVGILMAENPQAFQTAMADRDWEEFFEWLIAFLEKLIPLIIQIITIFIS